MTDNDVATLARAVGAVEAAVEAVSQSLEARMKGMEKNLASHSQAVDGRLKSLCDAITAMRQRHESNDALYLKARARAELLEEQRAKRRERVQSAAQVLENKIVWTLLTALVGGAGLGIVLRVLP
jgi:hypothetical protein